MAKMYPGMNSTEQESGHPEGAGLPSSGGEVLDRAGIKDKGYINTKGIPSGLDARFNYLPPGMNIEDQKNADIKEQKLYTWEGGLSYPKDGWT